MDIELINIIKFLAEYAPFKWLPEHELEKVAQNIEICYYREETPIIHFEDYLEDLYVIRSGAIEMYNRSGELYNRLESGRFFGQISLLTQSKARFSAKAIEDSLLYAIPREVIVELYNTYDDDFADFLDANETQRLRQAVSNNNENDFTTTKVCELLSGEAPNINKSTTIKDAATKMHEENVAALLVIDPDVLHDDEDDNNPVIGIITDRDFCVRAIAEGIAPSEPVTEIMSLDVFSLDDNAYVYEAMQTMLRYNVHHLPVFKNSRPIGIIEATDIVRYQSQSSLLLVSSIYQQNTLDELATLSEQIKYSFVRMVEEDANSHMIGTAMSVICRSFKQRVIELAEEELGAAPIPYCFLAFGSMGRDEQILLTDQDNGLILDNSYDKSKHGEYFERFARFISDGLAQCGYQYCSGNIMATNPDLRLTHSEWETCFADWIDKPNPKALLNASICFDLTGVYGQTKWADQLNSFVRRKAKRSPWFLAALARNALNRRPPLGFFKDFVMEKDGQHKDSINLKRRGTAPLADLIRVHALAVGSYAQNSFERLDDIADSYILPKGRAQDLRDALEFISMVRIRHQAYDVKNENEPDNNIEPDYLSDFEKRNLKAAFQVLSNAQNFLKYRYNAYTQVN